MSQDQKAEVAHLCEEESWPDLSQDWDRMTWQSQHGLWQGLMKALTPDFDYEARRQAGRTHRAKLQQRQAQQSLTF